MLPEFPKLKEATSLFVRELLKQRAKEKMGPLGDIRKTAIYEGDRIEISRSDGNTSEITLERFHADASISKEEYDQKGVQVYFDAMAKAGRDMGEQLAKFSYRRVGEEMERAGQVFKYTGAFSIDLVIRGLEAMDIDFDKDGNPKVQILVGRNLYEQILNSNPSAEDHERIERLLERKFNEFRIRESDRKLVD